MTPPKPLTDQERAAVDAAIAAGKLRRIPLGVFSECAINPVPMREQIRRSANAGKAAARAKTTRLRAALAEQPDPGLTPGEARIYAVLQRATGALTRHEIAEAVSTVRHRLQPTSVWTIICRLRKGLARAGQPWTVERVKNPKGVGSGYRLVPVEVAP